MRGFAIVISSGPAAAADPSRRAGLRRLAAVLLAVAVAALWGSEVDGGLSPDDVVFIGHVLAPLGIRRGAFADPATADFRLQLKAVLAIQRVVLTIAPLNLGIPLRQSREPADLARAGAGLCFDRSRSIEKFLRYAGFRVRHASLYADITGSSAARALLTPGNPSHAVTEVQTARGWMVVDSNVPWVALADDGRPLSLRDIARAVGGGASPPVRAPALFARVPVEHRPFVYVYGLYSRHGLFYPPFAPLPDVNWGELLDNLAA